MGNSILLTKNGKNNSYQYQTSGSNQWCEYAARKFRAKNILVKILKIIFK